MRKVLGLFALLGGVGLITAVQAAPVAATMVSVGSYSKSASAASPWTTTGANTATWTFDVAANTLAIASGTYARVAKVGATPLMTHTMTGVSMSSGNATGTTWTCTEGVFGGIVGAHICGNYNFGSNFTNDSTYNQSTPDAISATVTLGGDDVSLGAVQTLVNSYSNFTAATPIAGAAPGFQRYEFNNGQDLVPGAGDSATGFDAGYIFTFDIAVAPVAVAADDGPVDVLEATATDINVGVNDTNFTDPVTITRTTPNPTKGTAVVAIGTGNAADVTITYTSNVGATGTDTFGYSMTDGTNTDTATVTVNILAFGANDDNASTTRGVPVTVYPARNDAGFTPDTVTVTPGVCTSGSGTIVVTSGNGGPKQNVLVTYTPPANNPASGSATTLNDSCAYTIGNGVQPDDGANILVAVTNSVPVANDGNASALSTQGVAPAGRTATFTSPGTGGSLGNAGVTTAGNGTKGTTSVAGNVITYTVTDAAFFVGSDTFIYTVTDADGAASDEVDTGTVTVTIADVAPVIADGAITVVKNNASVPLSPVTTLGNGSAAQHTLAVTANGVHGSCTLSAANATGTVTYTPNAYYTGADSCVLTLTDGDGDTDTGTISITVNEDTSSGARNDNVTRFTSDPIVIDVRANDLGFNLQATLSIFTNPLHGTVTINGAAPGYQTITYTPFPGFFGTDTFRYVIDDGSLIDVALVTIRIVQDADLDGVDDSVDNCLGAANPGQQDGDGDGFGNWCDADFNNDGRVNFADLAELRAKFATTDPVVNLDSIGVVNFADLARFKVLFGKPPGPSALVP